MTTYTTSQIVEIINDGPFPYSLPFFTGKQKFPYYPSVEVSKVQSNSPTTEVSRTSTDQTFEITLLIKYTRTQEDEEADRITIENKIVDLLESYDFLPTGKIYFETKNWTTYVIDDSIYGVKSTLRFTLKEITSTTGSGIIGSGDVVELNSSSTPTQIQLLAISTSEGATIVTHMDDDGIVYYDPRDLINLELAITYESTTARDSVIKALADARTENNGKLIRGGVTTNYTFLVGQTTKSGQYGDTEKATTLLKVVGTW